MIKYPLEAAERPRDVRHRNVGMRWSVRSEELDVHPAWRRRGLASRLHEALLADRRADRRGPRVVLWVRADAPAAAATYARWGYRLVGCVPDRPPYQVMCLDRAVGKTNTVPAAAPHACPPDTADGR
jgi:GNAT superfamily N-acetyltransferase